LLFHEEEEEEEVAVVVVVVVMVGVEYLVSLVDVGMQDFLLFQN
jgi:hypothetical protein